jgi:alcohol dehydrogenase (cytochrome c)
MIEPRRRGAGAWGAAGAALLLAAGIAPVRGLSAAVPPAVSFTQPQVVQGRAAYGKACAVCHGANLEGGAGVALTGAPFARGWLDGHHGLHDFYDVVSKQMPKNAPGSLGDDVSLAITAFILDKNGFVAAADKLSLARLDATLAPPTGPGSPASGASSAPATAAALPAAPAGVVAAVQYPQRAARIDAASGTRPTDDDFLHMRDADWLTYNRNLAGDRFSPLRQIDVKNAGQLRVQCLLQLGELGSFEPSPVAYEGRLYLTTAHKVTAVDGATCATLWSYTYVPVDPEHLPGNRGVALYRGKVFRGTTDGHLIALDAATGSVLWDVRVADGALGYEITGAPAVFDGKVFTGDAGADVGINGRVYAFDAATGSVIWTFDIVPTGDQAGAETWGAGALHGGGATWSSMAIDPVRRLLFVPTGNPAADFNDKLRPGTNLYTDSVVALSLDTGKLSWYVQQVPHDVHDWDTAAAPALFEQGGKPYMAVTSKNGLMYVYDRDSHATLSQSQFTTRENGDVPLRLDAPIHVCPGALGQYNGPAYSPDLKMLFVGAADRCNTLQMGEPRYVPGGVYFGGVFKTDPKDLQSGWMRGFDAATGREVWSVHEKEPILAAVTPTAGGVLLSGNSGGEFVVYDARTGKSLYRFATGGPVAAGITTYAVAGRQYIAVPAGSSSRDSASANGAATLVIFALPK